MDSLQISGKQFISSNRAAKENGYTTDYIGQLIRANKLKGQKVGRAWYVLEESLNEFLATEKGNTKAGKLKKAEKEINKPATEVSKIEEQEIELEPILKGVPKTEPEQESEVQEKIVEEKIEEQASFPEISEEIKEESEPSKPEPKPAPKEEPKPIHIAPPREELIKRSSVREHVLMTYMREEPSSLPKKREESMIPIRRAEEPSAPPVAASTPRMIEAQPTPRKMRKKRVTWRAMFAILLLGMLAGAGTAAASVFIPAVLIYP